MNDNADIVKLITCAVKDRLAKGKREYKQEIDIHDGREWTQESLEEVLDLSVYLSAEILKRNNPKYEYVITMRCSDDENYTYFATNDNLTKMSNKELQHYCFWSANSAGCLRTDGTYDMEELRDVYVVSCVEISNTKGIVKDVSDWGWNLYVDDYKDTNPNKYE